MKQTQIGVYIWTFILTFLLWQTLERTQIPSL